MFSVVEFSGDDGGGLAVVNSKWLTPRKKQVFWPPVNEQAKFNRYLKTDESVNTETWILYKIRKIYYECDDLELANKKLKRAEQESDVYSSDIEPKQRRPIKRPVRLLQSSSDEDEQLTLKKRDLSPVKLPPDYTLKPKNILSTPTTSSQGLSPTNNLIPARTLDHQDNHGYECVLKEILKIKQQNQQILALLLANRIPNANTNLEFPENFPCALPLKNLVDVERVENVLNNNALVEHLVVYFSTRGGKDLRTKTNSILRNLMTDELASNYNYHGKLRKDKEFHKESFKKLHLNSVVIGVVKRNSSFTTDEIEIAIKSWLKHAPQRKVNKPK